MTMRRLRSYIDWLCDYLWKYNLFIPDANDYEDDDEQAVDPAIRLKLQRYSTWLYVFLFIIFLYVLFFIALVSPQSRVISVSNVTPSLFDQLSREHDETLSCPCSTITVPYSTFVISSASFHPVCSSVFVSRKWIEAFYLPIANAYLVKDFRTTAFAQVTALCSISNDTVSKALADVQSSQFVSVEVRQEADVKAEVQATLDLIRTMAPSQVTSFLKYLQMMYRSNTLVSALGTNAVVYMGLAVVMQSTYYITGNEPILNGSCAEKNSVSSAGFYPVPLVYDFGEHMNWPYYYASSNDFNASTSVKGFFGGCFALDAILASTLDCLYEDQCLRMLFGYFPSLNKSNFNGTNPLFFSGPRNISVNDLVSDLFIDRWSTQINYSIYFDQCSPSACTYSRTDSTNFSSTITLFLSLYGGLTAILRLIAPFLIQVIWSIGHRSIKIPFFSSLHNGKRWLKQLNIFKSAAHRTANDIRQQRLSTFCFLILLASSILSLLLFTSLRRQTIVHIEHSPTLEQYKQLESLYAETLRCPCTNSTIPYQRFLQIFPRFHQVCSSDLLSDSWITTLRNIELNILNTDTWMNRAARYFNLLSTVCQLANKTAISNTADFLARSLVTLNVLTERDFQNQLNTTIEQLIESIGIGFRLFMNLTRIFIQVDQPLIILDNSQITMNSSNRLVKDDNPSALEFDFHLNTVSLNDSLHEVCQCSADALCQGPLVFATLHQTTIVGVFGLHLGQRRINYTAPGLVAGCYSSDSLLFSTLQCFYNDTNCLQQMFNFINLTTHSRSYVAPLIYQSALTRFPPNTSFSSMMEEMLIEEWNISLSFADYYHTCVPIYCTYTQTEQAKTFLEVLVTAISIIGGLVIVLRLLASALVKIVLSLLKPPMKERQRGKEAKHLFQRGGFRLMKFLREKVFNLNLFPARTFPSRTDRSKVTILGQWSTRLYLILLMITFLILTLHTIIEPQTLTKTFVKPSLKFYRSLTKDHGETLQCPCTSISSPHSRFVQVQPRFHQICSSDFLSNQWQVDLTRELVSNLSLYSPTDYRRFLSAHLQFLRGLCQLSYQTVSQSIEQSLSSLFITKQFLSEEVFRLRINSMINETLFNAPTTLIRLLSLLRATNHGNAIVSSYETNFRYRALVVNFANKVLYTEPILYEENCSCQLNFTCIIQASVIQRNSTEPSILRGLKMGCTPSESFLASTLECFYLSSCFALLEQTSDYIFESSSAPLNTKDSRFAVNMTVMDLLADLFVEDWSSTMNYSSYFEHCSPISCSYTYSQQLDSLYTVISLLGLYGGLTIVLKWISPKLVYLMDKIHRRRKRHIHAITPTSSLQIATVKISSYGVNAHSVDRTTPVFRSIAIRTRSSAHCNCWIFALIILLLMIILILVPSIYIIQRRKSHPTSN